MNWINSWKAYNKKNVFEVNIRLGKITVLELMFCPCWKCENTKTSCAKFRMLILNLGFEL